MNKPSGMSRKDYHNIRSILQDFLSSQTVIVTFDEGFCYGHKSEATDEGFSATTVSVAVGDVPGTYQVTVDNRSRDCDGSHSSHDEMVVSKRSQRKRWYWNRNYTTDRPEGKFGVKSPWASQSKRSSQRDYTAESMGY